LRKSETLNGDCDDPTNIVINWPYGSLRKLFKVRVEADLAMDGLDGLRAKSGEQKSKKRLSRRGFLGAASGAAVMSGVRSAMELSPFGRLFPSERAPGADKPTGRIVDMHVHFDEKNPDFSTIC